MPEQPLRRRVQILERKVESLEQLPSRIDGLELQVMQLGEEMRSEFSAMRTELLRCIAEGDEETRRYMRVLHEEVIARIATIRCG